MDNRKASLLGIDKEYHGNKVVEGMLFKNKVDPKLFKGYVQRYFVLDLENRTFTYYSNKDKAGEGHVYKLNVAPYLIRQV